MKPKFKIGDRVRLTKEYLRDYGRTGVIIEIIDRKIKEYVVRIESDGLFATSFAYLEEEIEKVGLTQSKLE